MTNHSRKDARAALVSGLLLAVIVTVSGGFTILSARPGLPGVVGERIAGGKVSLKEIRHEAYCTYAVKRLVPGAINIHLEATPDDNTRIMRFGPDGANIARCEFLPSAQAGDVRMSKMSVNDKRLHRQVIDAINMRIDVLEYRRS
ncbi:hypothetical protein SAMN05892877_12111 [Rhizobium subbaraonis]|uniref:Uncharacterized protein n=1 Tax=Rhizobium subbaraonis TaxID=908946 RepID=A0A285UZF8_9HYPH|nr:hypothetical protein [Rhizobium subbaraonis]SOC46126.1 hypothetical protein SAMN05892877_12111 [Rhizobium subbaraonis]